MGAGIISPLNVGADINTIIAEADKSGSEARKSNRDLLIQQRQKFVIMAQAEVGKLLSAQSNMKKGGIFAIVIDVVVSIGQAVASAFPGVGTMVATGLSMVKNMALKNNPFQKAADNAKMDAQVLNKEVAIQDKRMTQAEQRTEEGKESERVQEKRLEDAQESRKAGHEAILRATA